MQFQTRESQVVPFDSLDAGTPFRFFTCTGYLYMMLTAGYCNLENGCYYPELDSDHSSSVVISKAEISE